MEWIAEHLGHFIEVHHEFSRLQESTHEICKISKLLMAIESGYLPKLVGKKLSDIELEHCFPEEEEINNEQHCFPDGADTHEDSSEPNQQCKSASNLLHVQSDISEPGGDVCDEFSTCDRSGEYLVKIKSKNELVQPEEASQC